MHACLVEVELLQVVDSAQALEEQLVLKVHRREQFPLAKFNV
jgi:hypothetical protein